MLTSGSKYINMMTRPSPTSERPKLAFLSRESERLLKSARERADRISHEASQRARERWHATIEHVRAIIHSPLQYRTPLTLASREHMNGVDCLDGERVRKGEGQGSDIEEAKDDIDLLEICPTIDGRLKDVARA